MKYIFFVAALLSGISGSFSQQNLVLNPSFEHLRHCPVGNNQIGLARYWNAIDSTVNPDSVLYFIPNGYFPALHDTCVIGSDAHCPNNDFYYQYPRTGHAMAAFLAYYNYFVSRLYLGDTVYRQHYVQGRLIGNLRAGVNYCVTFYVNMAERSTLAHNKFAAYLDDGTIDSTTKWNLPQSQYTPQVEESAIIADSVNWVKVQGSFLANGTEKFITIGVFADTASIARMPLTVDGGFGSFYLLDDVSVIESNANAFAGNDTSIRAGDTITRGQSVGGEGMPCYWYVLGSSTPIDSGGTLHAHPTTTTSYVIKMDLCGRVTYDTVKVNVWPLGLLSINAPHQQWQLYPNPNTGNFKLRCNQEINEKVTIQVFDLLGSLVYQQVSANVKTDITVDCAALPTAIYILKIVPDEGVPTVFRFNKN